jgi:hypothetical protein
VPFHIRILEQSHQTHTEARSFHNQNEMRKDKNIVNPRKCTLESDCSVRVNEDRWAFCYATARPCGWTGYAGEHTTDQVSTVQSVPSSPYETAALFSTVCMAKRGRWLYCFLEQTC